jgi:hypothetical protein
MSNTIAYDSAGASCPVDLVKVDETRVRVVAFFVLVLALVFIVSGKVIIVAFLLADFLLRAFNLQTWSPLAVISGAVVKQFGFKTKPVDRAPKRFAAFVGLVFFTAILILSALGFSLAGGLLTGVLIVFASLESFAGFCAGCYVYGFLPRFRKAG